MGIFRPPNIEKLKRKRNIKALLKALKHEGWETRRDAAIALGEIGDPNVIDTLCESLKDNHEDVWVAVEKALEKLVPSNDIKEYTRTALLRRENKEAVERLYKEWASAPFDSGVSFPGHEDEANNRMISWKHARENCLIDLVYLGDVRKIELILKEDQKRSANLLDSGRRKLFPMQQEAKAALEKRESIGEAGDLLIYILKTYPQKFSSKQLRMLSNFSDYTKERYVGNVQFQDPDNTGYIGYKIDYSNLRNHAKKELENRGLKA
ncbi:MAG: HEAT repeat domain-containing protein [bacterium]